MESKLFTLKEASDLINQGRLLVIAAAEKLLAQLPQGNWIGGSNPYLLGNEGGICSDDKLYVKDFTDFATEHKMKAYDASTIANVTTDAFENSIIVLIIPALTAVHAEFAIKAPKFENQYINPLLGWVSGSKFEDITKEPATTYLGNKRFNDKAIALHIKLPADKIGRIEIINPYEPGDTDEITFDRDAFGPMKDCFVNGKKTDLYTYINSLGDTTIPLVANYSGAMINIGIVMDHDNKMASLFAPVFKGTVYKVAKPVKTDYIQFLTNKVAQEESEIVYSYSCLYNYFNFQLEKKQIPGFVGTFTWGEVGFQLLNVTFVYLVIENKA